MSKAAQAVSTPARVVHPGQEAVFRFQAALNDLALGAREQLELVIAAGIQALDELDGDADHEPSLGFLEQRDQTFISAGYDGGADFEFQCEDEGVDTDREPEEAI